MPSILVSAGSTGSPHPGHRIWSCFNRLRLRRFGASTGVITGWGSGSGVGSSSFFLIKARTALMAAATMTEAPQRKTSQVASSEIS